MFNLNSKKAAMGIAAVAVLVPALTFAAGQGMQGHGGGFGFGMSDAVKAALTASGITLPTQADMQAERAQQEKVQAAMKNLSDADKATLKQMRETEAKAERDFLRSKGVPLETEDQIAAQQAQRQQIEQAIQAYRKAHPSTNEGKGGKRGGHFGPRGGSGSTEAPMAPSADAPELGN